MSSNPKDTPTLAHTDPTKPIGPLPEPTNAHIGELARKARHLAVLAACREDDPEKMAHIITNAISWAVTAVVAVPPFLTTADLAARYRKSRKWAERLPITSSKMQGARLYDRRDVMEYEEKCTEVD